MKRVGMIGLGSTGVPMSATLLKNGFAVVGCDCDAEKIGTLEKLGGQWAHSPREVAARAEVVVTLLPSVAALVDVIGGRGGLQESESAGLVVVEAGTFPIEDRLQARDALTAAGMVLLDCTISGTGAQAVRQDLAVHGSGDRVAYDVCLPVLNGFARSSYYLGEFGNGSRMKDVANPLVAIHSVAAAEAFVLGRKAGLDPETIHKVISDGAGTSPMF